MNAEATTTEDRCHCGADFDGSDHCRECGCEQFEATCDHVYVPRHCVVHRLGGGRFRVVASGLRPSDAERLAFDRSNELAGTDELADGFTACHEDDL